MGVAARCGEARESRPPQEAAATRAGEPKRTGQAPPLQRGATGASLGLRFRIWRLFWRLGREWGVGNGPSRRLELRSTGPKRSFPECGEKLVALGRLRAWSERRGR